MLPRDRQRQRESETMERIPEFSFPFDATQNSRDQKER